MSTFGGGRNARGSEFGGNSSYRGGPPSFGNSSSYGGKHSSSSKGSRGGRGSRYDNNWGGRGRASARGKGGREATLPQKQAVLKGHTDTVACLAVAEPRKQFFSGSTDGTVKVWGWEAGFGCVHTVSAGAPVECILSFDACELRDSNSLGAPLPCVPSHWLFAGTAATTGPGGVVNGVVRVWHMDNGFEQTLEGHQGSIFTLAQGGAYLFSGGDDMGVKTWQFSNDKFEPLINLTGHTAPIQDMKVVNNALISADRTGNVLFWDLATGQQTNAIRTGHANNLLALWVEDSHLFSSGLDGMVKVWDSTGSMLYEQSVTNQHNQPSGITSMLVTNDGSENPVLVTACSDNALKMWLMPTFDKRGILGSRSGHSDCVRCLAKGNSFFSGSMDHTIIVWEFMN